MKAVSPARQRLGDWLKTLARAKLLRVSPRIAAFECLLCERSFDVTTKHKKTSPAGFVAAHMKSCALQRGVTLPA